MANSLRWPRLILHLFAQKSAHYLRKRLGTSHALTLYGEQTGASYFLDEVTSMQAHLADPDGSAANLTVGRFGDGILPCSAGNYRSEDVETRGH